jgi:3-deoxy-manno-octulosonate cytidylyltransferase (CMP-KDO synthetase)
MKFTVLIPARLASTRLPNKPLADIHGAPMVVRVAQRALRSGAERVVVAADSDEIISSCRAFGIEALLTSPGHLSGSDRLAEACCLLKLAGNEIVVNLQGDEPLMDPDLIVAVAALLSKHPDCAMSTAAHAIERMADFLSPNVVKVVLDARGRALYFSRAPVPAARGFTGDAQWAARLVSNPPLRHIGIYGYRADFLSRFPQLLPAPIEQLESLEQLRALWHGHAIAVHVTETAPGPGVDTPEDLKLARALFTA